MSNNFWQSILAGLKALVKNIELELEKDLNRFLSVLGQIITAEEENLMNDALPLVRQIATNLQNEHPGMDAQSFITALIAAAVPALEAEGIKLANTAIAIVASSVAHQLTVPDNSGNAGVVTA